MTEIWPMVTRKCTGTTTNRINQASGPLILSRTRVIIPRSGFRAPIREEQSADTTNTGSISNITQSRS